MNVGVALRRLLPLCALHVRCQTFELFDQLISIPTFSYAFLNLISKLVGLQWKKRMFAASPQAV